MLNSNFDITRERLRQRISESSDSDYAGGYCDNCNAQLTQADIDNGRTCTNCGSNIDADDEGLEEDLLEVEQGDYTWDGYSHD